LGWHVGGYMPRGLGGRFLGN